MQAIILAAGMGKRLRQLTKNNTKCMVQVNGVPLIDRMLGQIDRLHLSRIVIVVGYEGQKLMDHIDALDVKTPVVFINNPIYDKTNNIYSLSLARDWLCRDDTLLFESDLIFEDGVIDSLLSDPRENLALVDKYESWMDGTCMKLGNDDEIISFVPGSRFQYSESDQYYKTVNIYKFSREFSETHYLPFLDAYTKALGNNEYYEQVLRVITMLDSTEIRAKRLNGEKWYEIDDIQDLDIASSMFAEKAEERAAMLQGRYGGYWRYPDLTDFCYLVNPYYPPKKMKDELRASFDTLLTEYPSGMRVNSLLASRNFGVEQDQIIAGNGAAELIKSFMGQITGKTGVIRPTFEEYPHRYSETDMICYTPDNPDYRYDADKLIHYFGEKELQNLLLINPDNPSGNYIAEDGVKRLIEWTKQQGIRFIVDASFVDSAEESFTLLDGELLDSNPHLIVVKSISKSYGVPGLRLGVLASGDRELIAYMKKDVAIWNINSFGEFFMQIEEKYRKDYAAALHKFKEERKRFVNELARIDGLRVIPSEANFIMAEITCEMSSHDLTVCLLDRYRLLIKDLSEKLGGRSYIRIAVRNAEDNDKLIEALRSVMCTNGAD